MAASVRDLRWAPPALVLSSAASLLISVPDTNDVRTVVGTLLGIGALLLLIARFGAGGKIYVHKAWVLRVASSLCSSAGIGVLLIWEPEYTAVLGAFLPLFGVLLAFGPSFGHNTGPGWQGRTSDSGGVSPSMLVWCAVDGYLLLAEAVVFQFLDHPGQTNQTIFDTGPSTQANVLSLLLSLVAILVIFSVALNEEVNFIRTWTRIVGLGAQVYISAQSVTKTSRVLVILCGVISGIFSFPATL